MIEPFLRIAIFFMGVTSVSAEASAELTVSAADLVPQWGRDPGIRRGRRAWIGGRPPWPPPGGTVDGVRMRDDALSIIVTGSSAALGMPGYLTWLRQEIDLSLRVLLTHSAERFLRREVAGWYADEVCVSDDPDLNPVEFARRSLGIVVLPATANVLAATALGLGSSPAQTALLAATRPALFFPAMNEVMWDKPVVRRHVEALRADGHTVVEPQRRPVFELWQKENVLGIGMPEPEEATELIVAWLEVLLDSVGEEEAEAATVNG
ncbi:flavoprotein [Lentzea rhizosphaerae]|uniref:Flavoprotein n=1 Tax=Lentzea rhizosphaerae TaxID=2041025 RepID=A0ABV8BK39_9PSEU